MIHGQICSDGAWMVIARVHPPLECGVSSSPGHVILSSKSLAPHLNIHGRTASAYAASPQPGAAASRSFVLRFMVYLSFDN
jgi:hypothetical protein